MADVKFFVEGSGDTRFLTDFVFHIFGNKLERKDFAEFGGNTIDLAKPNLYKENTVRGGTNLMIFDANGNFAEKQKEILSWKTKLDIGFELFLFPNNNDTGNLETLLENVSLPVHSSIFTCFDGYQDCIRAANADYTLPQQKARIFAYCEALLSKTKAEEVNENKRNYLNRYIWNLNSNYLDPLRDFLRRFI